EDIEEFQIGLSVKRSIGTVWYDDIRLAVVGSGTIPVESIDEYAPGQVDLGPAMVKRFEDLRDKKSPFLDQARVYNQLLVDCARACEDFRKLIRMVHYLEAHGKSEAMIREQERVAEIEKLLDNVYRIYGRLFRDRKEDGLEEFDRAAANLRKYLE